MGSQRTTSAGRLTYLIAELRLRYSRGRDFEESRVAWYSPSPVSAGVNQADLHSGVGKFTIADEAIVTEDDLGVNFFLDEEHLGQPRAAACARLLQELNPDVEAGWWPQSAVSTVTHRNVEVADVLYRLTHLRNCSPRT